MKIYKQEDKFFMEDQDNIVEVMPNKDYWLKLPANSCNRVWVSCAKVDKAPNQCVDYGDVVKQSRTTTGTSHKKLEDWLNDEDRATYLALVEKAQKAKEDAKKKPMSKLEKAQKQVEKWMKLVQELQRNEKIF